MAQHYDAVVVGSGPNGLAAATELGRHGWSVLVVEGADEIGGGTRTAELTVPGHRHDICSAVHPLGAGSPFFRSLPLERFGLEWVHPTVAMSHPLPDGDAVALHRALDATADGLGADGDRYLRHMTPLVSQVDELLTMVLRPLLRPPRHPVTLARFGIAGVLPATMLARTYREQRTRALIAGLAAHSITALSRPLTSAVGLLLAVVGHAFGWPFARGGSASIARALGAYVEDLGGQLQTGRLVASLDELPPARAYVLDVMPAAAAAIGGHRVTKSVRRLRRWRHGPASFKVDWALSSPIPWSDPLSRRAGTVHVGGTDGQIAAAEAAVAGGEFADRPFVLVTQPTLFDDGRAPEGRHVAWGYCHVPAGFAGDATTAIEGQIERFAPGFRSSVVARHVMGPAALETHNPNYVGGDIGGGAFGIGSVVARPRLAADPYRLGPDVWLCSSATPPGAGVHGMSGFHAARSVLRALL